MIISTIEVEELKKIENPLIIDVREPEEFKEARAKSAISFPLGALQPKEIVKELGVKEEQTIYIICKVGGRSLRACTMFKEEGIENVVNVEGGTDSWIESGGEVESG